MIGRAARNLMKQLWQRGFELGQRVGVNITPNHFYSDIPDFRELRRETRWRRGHSMVGIAGAPLEGQWEFVESCCRPVAERLSRGGIHAEAVREHGEMGYGQGDAAFLHAFVVRHRPPRIVQVGCGVSTFVMLRAAKEAGYTPEVLCVEPFPGESLRRAEREGKITLLVEKAQYVAPERLAGVGEGGLLFVDSTHALRPASDVAWVILEALPRLPRGSWAHFHDISFPYDYHPRMLWKFALFFPHETTVLQAFLCGNERFEIAASLAMLNNTDSARLAGLLRDYHPAKVRDGLYESEGDFASAAYLRVR
jgi:hypothetical protein